MRIILSTIVAVAMALALPSASFGAHPLITDDTGTQGKGKFQLEVNGGYSRDSDNGAVTRETEFGPTLSYGVNEKIDLVVGAPYVWTSVKVEGDKTSESGLSDVAIALKWRFYETEGMSFALKPGVTLPTGDEDRGLGTGRATYSLFFIATKELKPLTFHLNLGYIRNENKFDEQKDLWHASLASEVGIARDLRLAANIGIERTTDRDSGVHPAFFLVGLIYGVAENFDIDAGIKWGLNKAEADYQFLAGISYRF